MGQKIQWGNLSGKGIVVVLFIMGVVLYFLNIMRPLGQFLIVVAAVIGIVYALMGAAGIARRNGWR